MFRNTFNFFSFRHFFNVSLIVLRIWNNVVVLSFFKRIICTFVYEMWISWRKYKRSNNRFNMIISLNLIRWDLAISICEYTSIRSIYWWYVIKYLSFKLVSRSLFFIFCFFLTWVLFSSFIFVFELNLFFNSFAFVTFRIDLIWQRD